MPSTQTPITQPPVTPPAAAKPDNSTVVTVHDSNPFTTTMSGIKKLFHYNTGTLVTTVLFNIVVGLFIIVSAAATLVASMGLFFKYFSQSAGLTAQPFPPFLADIANMGEVALYSTLLIGLALLVFFVSLLQAIQLKLATASSAGQVVGFGDVVKQAFRRVWAMVGLTLLMVLVLFGGFIGLGLLSSVIGPIAAVLILIAAVVAVYFGVRLTFATFAVVEENFGPVASIKRSMALTKGHFVETLGIVAASSVVVLVPTLILELLGNLGGAVGGVFQVLSLLVALVVTTLAMAGFAERFVQLRNIEQGKTSPTKTHVLNYVAIVAFIVVAVISNALTPADQPGQNQNDLFDQTQLEQQLQGPDSQPDSLDQSPSTDKPSPDNYNLDDSSEPSYNVN